MFFGGIFSCSNFITLTTKIEIKILPLQLTKLKDFFFIFYFIYFIALFQLKWMSLNAIPLNSSCFASCFWPRCGFVVGHECDHMRAELWILSLMFSGFRMNASSWPMFLLRTLNGAEMAPATAFKKVLNLFVERSHLRGWPCDIMQSH